jgi:hypothetical protein
MPTRKLLVLTGVFVALLAFVVFFESKQPTSEERAKSAKRLAEVNADEVASVVIERPDLPKVELVRRDKNRWTLKADPEGPADGFACENLVGDLGRLDVVGEIQTAFDPKEFGLDAPKAKATLRFKDKSEKVFSFGQPIPAMDATAAAEGGHYGAVKSAPLASLTKPVDEYRSRSLFETPSVEITRVTVTKGPNTVVVTRAAKAEGAAGGWKMEKPVADLASDVFVDRLLAGLSSGRISEFAKVQAAELSRVGLAPAWATVKLEKEAETVATIAFGAAKADANGKIYAKVGNLVVVVDDRVREDLDKEVSAWREDRILPVEVPTLRRVSYAGDELRAGAEKVEGSWRSAGHDVVASVAEALGTSVARTDVKAFLPKRAGKAAREKPLATLELLSEGDTTPRIVTFYDPPAGVTGVLAEATGRPEPMLVERAVLDDIVHEASVLRDASTGKKDGGKAEKPVKAKAAKAADPAPVKNPTPAKKK